MTNSPLQFLCNNINLAMPSRIGLESVVRLFLFSYEMYEFY